MLLVGFSVAVQKVVRRLSFCKKMSVSKKSTLTIIKGGINDDNQNITT